MCLYIRRPFKNLKGFIHVYKVGLIFDDKFLSPYQRTVIPFNTLWNDPMFYENYGRGKITVSIREGFVHCYDNYNIAKNIADNYYSVFDAIIPSNSTGYWGYYHDICTNKIIILNPKLSGYNELAKKYGVCV